MSSNHYNFKARVMPKDYLNGDVRVFSREEIAQWEASSSGIACRQKMEAQAKMDEAEIKFLDNLALFQAEDTYAEVMEGVSEGGSHDVG